MAIKFRTRFYDDRSVVFLGARVDVVKHIFTEYRRRVHVTVITALAHSRTKIILSIDEIIYENENRKSSSTQRQRLAKLL